jgi:hypothetical protein
MVTDPRTARRAYAAAMRDYRQLLAQWAQHWREDTTSERENARARCIEQAERRVAQAEEQLRRAES